MSRDFLEVFSSFPSSSVNFSLVWFSSCVMLLRCSSPLLWFPEFSLTGFSKEFLPPLLYWTPWIFSWVETKFRTWKKEKEVSYHIFHFNWTFLKWKLLVYFFSNFKEKSIGFEMFNSNFFLYNFFHTFKNFIGLCNL